MKRWRSLRQGLIGRVTPRPKVDTAESAVRYAFGLPAGRIDTRQVAADAGVSQRTVQRWLSEGMPATARSAGAARVAEAANQRWEQKEVDRQRRRRERFSAEGSPLVVRGRVQVSGDQRVRTIGSGSEIALSGEQMADIYQARQLGGDDAAADALSRAAAESFGVRDLQVSDIQWLDLDR